MGRRAAEKKKEFRVHVSHATTTMRNRVFRLSSVQTNEKELLILFIHRVLQHK